MHGYLADSHIYVSSIYSLGIVKADVLQIILDNHLLQIFQNISLNIYSSYN